MYVTSFGLQAQYFIFPKSTTLVTLVIINGKEYINKITNNAILLFSIFASSIHV